jgi:hypothetical protein
MISRKAWRRLAPEIFEGVADALYRALAADLAMGGGYDAGGRMFPGGQEGAASP